MANQGVWTLAEAQEGKLKSVSFELLTRGKKLADKLGGELISVLITGEIKDQEIEQLLLCGADRVIMVSDFCLEELIVENHSNVLVDLIENYKPEILLAAATTYGRTLMPHVAVRVKTGLTADCTELDIEEETGNLLQTRPAIGGNIMATIKTPEHRPQMATVRPKSTKPASPDLARKGQGKVEKIKLNPDLIDGRVKRVSFKKSQEKEVNIQEADIVVAGGKGLKRKEDFTIIWEMAEHLGGAVGASRDAVDRDWISYPHQVGLSGKTVTPKIYIAIGISGAIQHLAGMKTADKIIAINQDPDAPIFKLADLGIVGDLFEIVPELNKRLAEEAGKSEL